jgi:hypothetical protein
MSQLPNAAGIHETASGFIRGRFTRALPSFLPYSAPEGIVNRNVEP